MTAVNSPVAAPPTFAAKPARTPVWERRSTKVLLSLFDQGLVSGTRFLTTVAVGRFCGAHELGLYSLVFGVLLLVVGIQEALISVPFTINRSRRTDQALPKYLGSVLVHSLLLSIVAGLVIVPLAGLFWLSPSLSEMSNVLWMLAAVLPVVLARELARRVAFSMLAVGPAVFIDLIASIIQLGVLGALIGMDLLTSTAAVAALGVGSLLGLVCWWLRHTEAPQFEAAAMKADFSENWSFGRWALGGQVVQVSSSYLMHWMLALLMGAASTGHFAACMALMMMTNPIMLGISNLLVPAAAHEHNLGAKGQVGRVILKATLLMMAISSVFLATVVLFGGQVLTLVYGPSFASGSGTLVVLAVATTVAVVGLATHDGLWAMNRPDVNLTTSLLGVIVMVPIGFWLIPHWGEFGAACCILVGRVITSVVRCGVFCYLLGTASPHPADAGGAG